MEKECQQRIENITKGFKECQKALVAIGDETRQLILLVLLQSKLSGIRVGEIAQKTYLTRPTVSHHLQILKEAGIINVKHVGTKNYYYISGNETCWKTIVELVNTIYDGILQIEK